MAVMALVVPNLAFHLRKQSPRWFLARHRLCAANRNASALRLFTARVLLS